MADGRLWIDGAWVQGEHQVEVRAPWDGRLLRRVTQASPAQVEQALAVASGARERLQGQSTGKRREVLEGIVAGLGARAEEMAQSICHEAGKPIAMARVEVRRAIEVFRLAAAELSRFGGSVVPVESDRRDRGSGGEVRRFPAGVVVGIVPFNFPLNLGAHKVAPALAVGAPIVVKPPPQAPGAQLLLAEIVQQAGADRAAFQVVTCDNAVAERLATDPRVRILSFTGSAAVGWSLKQKAPGRVLLELGGNAAALVGADADLDWAAERCVAAGFGYAGQVCIKVQRVFVEKQAHGAFLESCSPGRRRWPPGTRPTSAPCAGRSSTIARQRASPSGSTRRWPAGRGCWPGTGARAGCCSPPCSPTFRRSRRRQGRRSSGRWSRSGRWRTGRRASGR